MRENTNRDVMQLWFIKQASGLSGKNLAVMPEARQMLHGFSRFTNNARYRFGQLLGFF
jgi:hypothetical protein